MKLRVFIVLFFICTTHVISQDKKNTAADQPSVDLTIDLDKAKPSKSFPFDEFIDLGISSKRPLHNYFELVPVKYRDNQVRQKEFGDNELSKYEDLEAGLNYTNNRVQLKKEGKLYLARMAPLVPNKLYELIFYAKNDSKKVATYFKFKQALNDQELNKDDIYKNEIRPWFVIPNREQQIINVPDSDAIESFVTDRSFNFLDETLLVAAPLDVDKPKISNIANKLQSKEINTQAFTKLFVGLIDSLKMGSEQMYKGYSSAEDYNANSKKYEYHKRLDNLKKSAKIVALTEIALKKLVTFYATDTDVIGFYNNEFKVVKKSISHNIEELSKYLSKKTLVLDSEYKYPIVVQNTSGAVNDKENKVTYLVSDFGFMSAWGVDQFDSNKAEYIGRPYLGLNWHIGGFKKGKRVSQIARKRIWHQWSVAIGLTIGDIDEGGYSDLFSDLSPSLGVNYRLTQDVRIGIGGLVLKKDRNPIIEKEGVAILGYFSISFDYRLFADLIIASRIFN